MLHRLVLGTDGKGDLLITEPRRNVLILGPPGGTKTAGVLTPAILAHPGPVVTASTKDDVLRATGLVRARLGRVWHYGPDGSPVPPGCRELRWSPITASKSWGAAVGLGESMANVAEVGGRRRERFVLPREGRGADPSTAACRRARRQADALAAEGGCEQQDGRSTRRRTSSKAPWADDAASSPSTTCEGILDLDPKSPGPDLRNARERLRGLQPPWSPRHDRGAELRSR